MNELARAVEIFAAINFIAMGISHIVRPREWSAFFGLLHSKGAAGNFMNAFLALGMGSIIVAFHNVWTGVPMALTIYGWLSVFKGALYLAFPAIGLRSIERGSSPGGAKFAVAGVVLLALGVAVLFFGVETETVREITIPVEAS